MEGRQRVYDQSIVFDIRSSGSGLNKMHLPPDARSVRVSDLVPAPLPDPVPVPLLDELSDICCASLPDAIIPGVLCSQAVPANLNVACIMSSDCVPCTVVCAPRIHASKQP
jgi:hypothetical protein